MKPTLPGFRNRPPTVNPRDPLHAQVSEVIQALNGAQRPMLLAGNGIRLATGAEKEFPATRSKRLDIPLETTWAEVIDLIGDSHPLFTGRPGSDRSPRYQLRDPELRFPTSPSVRVWIASSPALIRNDLLPLRTKSWSKFIRRNWLKWAIRCTPKSVPTPVISCAPCSGRKSETVPSPDTLQNVRLDKRRCADWKVRYPIVLPEHRVPQSHVSVYHYGGMSSPMNFGMTIISFPVVPVVASSYFSWPCGLRPDSAFFIPRRWAPWVLASQPPSACVSPAIAATPFAWTATADSSSIFRNWRPSRA